MNIIEEPFNENFTHWDSNKRDYRELVHDIPSYEYYLLPAVVKLNSAATYAFVPNAREIQEACGNNLTEWLFESRLRSRFDANSLKNLSDTTRLNYHINET